MARVTITVLNEDVAPERRALLEVLGVEDTGASPRGSTYYGTLMKCPREFALTYVVGLRPERPSEALTIGWLYHYCLQRYYEWVKRGSPRDGLKAVYDIVDLVGSEPGYTKTVNVLKNILDGYIERYEDEDKGWKILAVEETLQYKYGPFELSARLDLLVDDGGFWITEHKTARAISDDLIDNYQLDFQILAQMWLTTHTLDLSKYPRLRGVRVNIATKAVHPKFVRVEVCPSPAHLKAFERQVLDWRKLKDFFEKLGWPQSFGRCAGYARGYSKCQYYELCHGHPTTTVEEWKNAEEPPYGFTRVGDVQKDILEDI
jgi:hypothetical protein